MKMKFNFKPLIYIIISIILYYRFEMIIILILIYILNKANLKIENI